VPNYEHLITSSTWSNTHMISSLLNSRTAGLDIAQDTTLLLLLCVGN